MSIRVLFICHGNICRSTLAQSVFTHKVASQGLSAHFLIDSAATSTEEIGNPPHRGTVNKLRKVGIPLVPHRARQVTWADYEKFDYIIGMDSANIRNLNRMLKGDPEGKIYKFLTFAGSDRDIADPWYTGDFDATYEDVLEGCVGFLAYLKEQGQFDEYPFQVKMEGTDCFCCNLSVCWRNIRAIRGLKNIFSRA